MANLSRYFYVLVVVFFLAGCAATPDKPAAEQKITKKAAEQVTKKAEALETKPSPTVIETETVVEQPVIKPVAEVVEPSAKKESASLPEPVVKSRPMAMSPEIRPAPNKKNWFNVDSAIKNRAHPFFGVGHKRGFVVNGEQGKPLVLVRGETYTFDVKTGVAHDFYFTRIAKGWGAGTYAEGIDGQFTFDGEVTFTPGATAPNMLYYGCRNHKNMGGAIYVTNEGEKFTIPEQKVAIKKDKPVFDVTTKQVKQKLSYAKLLVLSSKTSKRVAASNNPEAKAMVGDAKAKLTEAESSLSAEKPVVAMAAVDEALRLVSTAARLVPAESTGEGIDYKSEYDKLTNEIQGYKKSYKKNLSKVSGKPAGKLDEAKFKTLLKDAESLANKDDYQSAVKPLQKAATMITASISSLLDNTTVVYDKEFASPEEEYGYELARYESYIELVPIAIEQRRPGQRKQDLMKSFIDKGKRIAGEGEEIAAKGGYAKAVQAMQAATENVRRALMIIGVR
ncbi:MAG: hypothetical protein GXP14_15340 [Gammaproteobacteria bacterium]|nr:hypothetical protein [Gammaproteobacteria bacterium]